MIRKRVLGGIGLACAAGLAMMQTSPLLFPQAETQAEAPDLAALTNRTERPPAAKARTDIDTMITGSMPSGTSVTSAESVSDGLHVRVVVHALQNVTIGAEINARITGLGFKDGEMFQAGDVLVRLDCTRIAAELASARAANNVHRTAFESNQRMLRYKAVGALTVQQSRYEMEKSAADIVAIETRQASCTIVAPFSGRLVETLARVHEAVAANQPVLKIVDDSKPELDLITPSNWLGWVKIGTPFEVVVDETGETIKARILRIGGAVDPVSQTVRMSAEMLAPKGLVLSGMSGTATFTRQEKP